MLRNATKVSRLRTKIFLLWVCYDIVNFLVLNISELICVLLYSSVIIMVPRLTYNVVVRGLNKSSKIYFQKVDVRKRKNLYICLGLCPQVIV